MAGLTIKQEKFCQGLFSGLTQREAYKQSYNCERQSDKTIDENASRMANNSKVVARLEELTNELKERNMVTVEKVLAEYSKIAFADIKDFLEFRTEKNMNGLDDEGKPVFGYQQVIEMKPSGEVDGTMIQEVSISPKGVFSFKLHDKKGSLDMIGKHLGMFKDNLNINANLTVQIVDDID